jgi:hypothetical protein
VEFAGVPCSDTGTWGSWFGGVEPPYDSQLRSELLYTDPGAEITNGQIEQRQRGDRAEEMNDRGKSSLRSNQQAAIENLLFKTEPVARRLVHQAV